MKNLTNYFFGLAVLAYSVLFYKQAQGINYLIFSASLLVLLVLSNRGIWQRAAWCYVAGATCSRGSAWCGTTHRWLTWLTCCR